MRCRTGRSNGGGVTGRPSSAPSSPRKLIATCVPKPLPFNVALVGPVIAAFGTEEQKRRFLPAIANLDLWFCQGFSEPNAGPDLASLKTATVREGDHYRVNGQKIWTTYAEKADWIFCLVRTLAGGAQATGHFLPADRPQDARHHHPADPINRRLPSSQRSLLRRWRVPAENLVGEEGKGWDYARHLLGQERTSMGNVGFSRRRLDRVRKLASEAKGESGGKPDR